MPRQPASDETPTDGLVDALVQSAFTTMAVLTKAAGEHELSLTQLRVLAILRDRQVRMSTLAEYLGLEKSTMTGLVDRAETRGLLRRTANATDGRAVDVALSAEGRAFADRLTEHVRRSLNPLIEQLRPGDQRRLQTLLETMLAPNEP